MNTRKTIKTSNSNTSNAIAIHAVPSTPPTPDVDVDELLRRAFDGDRVRAGCVRRLFPFAKLE